MTETITLTNGTTVEPGCYIDGHWGQYGPSRVLSVADDILGTHYFDECIAALDDEIRAEMAESRSMSDEIPGCETVIWVAEEAEQALNDATPDSWAWGWHDGEFFLWSDEQWEEMSY